jgi:hypothetical protein
VGGHYARPARWRQSQRFDQDRGREDERCGGVGTALREDDDVGRRSGSRSVTLSDSSWPSNVVGWQ